MKARDRALEELHTRAQIEAADAMRRILSETLIAAKANFAQMKSGHPSGVDSFEHMLKNIFTVGVLYDVLAKLRVRSYTLAKASESEIIAQMSHGKMIHANVRGEHLYKARTKPSMAGGPALQRLAHYLDRMRRKIVSFAQGAALTAPDVTAFLIDVHSCFPKKRIVKRPRRILKPQLMEADKPKPGPWDNWAPPPLTTQTISDDPPADVAIDNIDDAAWQDMLAAYKDEYVPQWRDPAYVVDLPITDPTIQADGTEVYYAWEFERDLTNEFVQSVRDGTLEAANENGITDFVWIAVIDDRTDQCCSWRDGLLVSEIEAQLDDHTDEDADCDVEDGLVPPIHFGCRCALAPATDNVPDKPDDMSSEFSDWLET